MEDLRGQVLKMRSCRLSVYGTFGSGRFWGSFCAAAVFIAIPVSILFVFMQKYYVSGVTGGAVKG